MRKNIWFLCVLCLVIISCVGFVPTSRGEDPETSWETIMNTDCGPMPENYQSTIESYLAMTLIDPSPGSYRLMLGEPEKNWYPRYPGVVVAWAVCGRINGKNTYGGFTGWQPVVFFIEQGRVSKSYSGTAATAACTRY